jgi:hypothetical protein
MPSPKKGLKRAKGVAKQSTAKGEKHERVEFWVVAEGGASHYSGTVVVRPTEMVLEIDDQRGGTYLLSGRLTGGTYNAIESNPPIGARPVRARWTRLGPYYVGTWLEEDADNLFRFRLAPES